MKRVAGDEELQVFPAAQVRPDDNAVARAVTAQQQDLERIAEVVVVELIVADAVELPRCSRRYHEIERGAHRSWGGKRRRQPAGRDRLRAEVSHAHEPARGMRLEPQ